MFTLMICYKNSIFTSQPQSPDPNIFFILQFVRFTFDDFEVGVSGICEEEYLFIYEGDGGDDDLPKYTFCGRRSGAIVVKFNVVTLFFQSSESRGRRGFSLTYETFLPGKHDNDYHPIN